MKKKYFLKLFRRFKLWITKKKKKNWIIIPDSKKLKKIFIYIKITSSSNKIIAWKSEKNEWKIIDNLKIKRVISIGIYSFNINNRFVVSTKIEEGINWLG